eukprot:366580-Pyramimonas_sp.AAC.1
MRTHEREGVVGVAGVQAGDERARHRRGGDERTQRQQHPPRPRLLCTPTRRPPAVIPGHARLKVASGGRRWQSGSPE